MKKILRFIAKKLIKKYKPVVVGITGSVGKTSAKSAADAVLSKSFRVRASQKSQNNEFGLPMTVIGVSAVRSAAGWLFLVLHGVLHLVVRSRRFPQVLVLEMGADHPGDLDYLQDIALPTIGVITGVSAAHTEFFKSVQGVLKEKQKIITRLDRNGVAVLNADDELAMSVKDKTQARVITYGLHEQALVRATQLQVLFNERGFPAGMQFKVEYKGNVVPMKVNGVLGEAAVSTVVAGIAVGIAAGMNLVDIAKGIDAYEPPPGRMRLLEGIKNTLLIDDSYNSSPRAALAALRAFEFVRVTPPAEKWVVFGDMRELGELSERSHREVGHAVTLATPDHLVTVGELAKEISDAAQEAGMHEEYVYEFADSVSAARFIQEKITPGSAVLVKGSQAVRMERVAKELMADPLSAERLLVRQDAQWKDA